MLSAAVFETATALPVLVITVVYVVIAVVILHLKFDHYNVPLPSTVTFFRRSGDAPALEVDRVEFAPTASHESRIRLIGQLL